MTQRIKILLIEDNPLTSQDLREIMEENNCEVYSALTYSQAREVFKSEELDAAFIDITLEGSPFDGIEIAEELLKTKNALPIVFLTAHSEKNTIRAALNLNPVQYLIKPYNEKQVILELDKLKTLVSRAETENGEMNALKHSDVIFFADKGLRVRLQKSEIVYIKAAGSYIQVYLKNEQEPRTITIKFGAFQQILPDEQFVQVHRSYMVNLHFVEKYNISSIILSGFEESIPLSHRYKAEFERKLPILYIRN